MGESAEKAQGRSVNRQVFSDVACKPQGETGPHSQAVKLNVTAASDAMRLKLRSSSLRGSFHSVTHPKTVLHNSNRIGGVKGGETNFGRPRRWRKLGAGERNQPVVREV
jgi:hypothetical protein